MKKNTLLRQFLHKLKPLEKANKEIWFAIFRALFRNKPLEKKLLPAQVKKVLLLRYDAIGDMITTLPMIRYLKLINPEMQVDVLASGKNYQIIENDPNVREIFVLPKKFYLRLKLFFSLRKENYDVIFICIFEKASVIGIIANIIGGATAIKSTPFRGEKYWLYYNVNSKLAREKMSMWDRLLYLVYDTIETGIDPYQARPYLTIKENSRDAAQSNILGFGFLPEEKFILINLTTKQVHNKWTAEGYNILVQEILRRAPDYKIVLLWMDEDEALAKGLERISPGRIFSYPPTNDILEIAALVGKSFLLVSPDTSTVHMASALGKPVLGLYIHGNKSALEWGPYRISHFRTVESEEYEWVRTIQPDSVVLAFFSLLAELEDSSKIVQNE